MNSSDFLPPPHVRRVGHYQGLRNLEEVVPLLAEIRGLTVSLEIVCEDHLRIVFDSDVAWVLSRDAATVAPCIRVGDRATLDGWHRTALSWRRGTALGWRRGAVIVGRTVLPRSNSSPPGAGIVRRAAMEHEQEDDEPPTESGHRRPSSPWSVPSSVAPTLRLTREEGSQNGSHSEVGRRSLLALGLEPLRRQPLL